jgi:hypothetical protein
MTAGFAISHPQEKFALIARSISQSPYLLWARTWQKQGIIQINRAPVSAIGTEYVDLSRKDMLEI